MKIKKKEISMIQTHERPVSTVEIFEAMLNDGEIKKNDSVERLDNILKMYNFEKSLSTKASDDGDMELSDMISNDSPSALETMLSDEKKQLTLSLLNKIPQEDRIYVKEYFGFDTNIPLTFKEIAEKHGKTNEFIRSTVTKNLLWLKRTSRSNRAYFIAD
jgi:DNA-directed RNA polymerase sigma subunit (sigma70/sigma32)